MYTAPPPPEKRAETKTSMCKGAKGVQALLVVLAYPVRNCRYAFPVPRCFEEMKVDTSCADV